MEGAPHTAKRLSVVFGPCPVYKGGEEEAGQQGARQGEGSPSRIRPHPFFPSTGGGKGEGEGVGEGKGGGAPFPSPIRPPPLWGAHQPLVGWLASLLWPIRPMSFPVGGGSGNLPVLRKNARITRNQSDVRMQPSDI